MHRFRDVTTYWSKIAEKPNPPSFGTFLWGDPLRIFRRLIYCQKLVGAYARGPAFPAPRVRWADLFIARLAPSVRWADRHTLTLTRDASQPKWQYPAEGWELESWGYQMVYISRSCFRSARHNTGVWRTSGRTDRLTDGRTRRYRKDPR